MNIKFFNGYVAIAALMVALPLTTALSSSVGSAGNPAGAGIAASVIMPETANQSLEMIEAVSESQANAADAGQQLQPKWGDANPDIYARIALAFGTEALDGAELMDVQCRESLCRVTYEAADDMPVRRLLPMQLAESFHAMVTVHAGGSDHVFVDVP